MQDIGNREDIKLLIDTFYDKIKKDEVIGYFFNEVVDVDWNHHLPKMYDFWETTLFHKAIYKGNPMPKHVDIHKKAPMKKEHFDHWLTIFKATVDELFEGEKAIMIKQRAQSIATVMMIKVL
jgi:hemoglobin